MKNVTFNDCGTNRTLRIDLLAAQLQEVHEDGRDTEMAVNTKQHGVYKRMDGYFMGAVDDYGLPSEEVFNFQDKVDGEYYIVKLTEIVRTY